MSHRLSARSFFLALPVAIGLPAMAHAASFDCGRARAPDERAICRDRALNDQDVRMALLLGLLSQLQLMGANGEMQDDQRQWLAARHSCRDDRTCLARAYDRRVSTLKARFAAIASRVQ